MKSYDNPRIYPALFLLLFFMVIVGTKPAQAQKDGGWIELIDGTFAHWKAGEQKSTWTITPEGYYQAEGPRSHLFYTGPHLKDGFKNFEIEVQVRTFELANSGIYFHTEYQETGWPQKGIEIQVNNTHIGEGTYIERKKMGSLYGVRNLYKSFAQDSTWMTVRARVESNRVQVWLNGLQTVDYTESEPLLPGVKHLSKGTFCLQGHDIHSKMQYKSFRVRRLPDAKRSDKKVPRYGAWLDSLFVYQQQQFAFVDLNPPPGLSAKALSMYVYQTGINAALVRSHPVRVKGLPLFTGLRVKPGDAPLKAEVDYRIGESQDLAGAESLLQAGNINVWSDKGRVLNDEHAAMLLDLARQQNIAIEIDNVNRHPSIEVLKLAKARGCKFTFAGLLPATAQHYSLYVLEAIRGAGLDYRDQYIPK